MIGEVSGGFEDFSAEVAEMFFTTHPVWGCHVNVEVALALEVLATLLALVVLKVWGQEELIVALDVVRYTVVARHGVLKKTAETVKKKVEIDTLFSSLEAKERFTCPE